MTYSVFPDPNVEAKLRKLWKKDPARFGQVEKKLLELAENPEIGKPLRQPLKGLWRLHIGHHVLMYRIDKKNRKITLVDYAHHDDVY